MNDLNVSQVICSKQLLNNNIVDIWYWSKVIELEDVIVISMISRHVPVTDIWSIFCGIILS